MARAQAQRRKTSRTRAQRSSSSVEDLMFFPKLRRKAKWVFLLLAIAFAVGFVAFGVGTGVGGTSIGDVLRDIFSSSSGGQDLSQMAGCGTFSELTVVPTSSMSSRTVRRHTPAAY